MDRTPLKFTGSSTNRSSLRATPVAMARTSTPLNPQKTSAYNGGSAKILAGFMPSEGRTQNAMTLGSLYEKRTLCEYMLKSRERSVGRPDARSVFRQPAKMENSAVSASNPIQRASDRLYDDFYAAVRQHVSLSSIMELLDALIVSSDEVSTKLKELRRRVALPDAELDHLLKVENSLGKEWSIWSLLRDLHAVRIDDPCATRCPPECALDEESATAFDDLIEKGTCEDEDLDGAFKDVSERMVVYRRVKTDKKVRKLYMIIKWLEEWMRRSNPPGITKLSYFNPDEDLELFQSDRRTHPTRDRSSNDSVLSPSMRSARGDLDLDEEHKLTAAATYFLRTGQKDRFKKLAIVARRTEWLNVCECNDYYHDPSFCVSKQGGPGQPLGDFTRQRRKLWFFSVAEDLDNGEALRRVAAISACNLSVMLSFAETWEEALWAYVACLFDQTMEREIIETFGMPEDTMPSAYWKNDFSLETIFTELESSPNPEIRQQANSPMMKLIKAIILDEARCFASLGLHPCVDDEVLAYGHQMNRFLSHLVLFYRSIGSPLFPNVFMDKTFVEYAQFLMSVGKTDPALFYLSAVRDKSKATEILAEFFRNFGAKGRFQNGFEYGDVESRVQMRQLRDSDLKAKTDLMERAEAVGLNARAAAIQLVEESRKACRAEANLDAILSKDFTGVSSDVKRVSTGSKVTDEDFARIDALDWMLVEGRNPSTVIVQINALARCFLLRREVKAARLALDKLPSQDVDAMSPRSFKSAALNNTSAIYRQDEKHVREYEGLRALTLAIEQYEKFSSGTGKTDDNSDTLSWYSRLKTVVSSSLQRVLDFPYGWLQDRDSELDTFSNLHRDDDDEDEADKIGTYGEVAKLDVRTRRKEMMALKTIYIPLVLQMISEVHSREVFRGGSVKAVKGHGKRSRVEKGAGGDASVLMKGKRNLVRRNALDPAFEEKISSMRGLMNAVSAFPGNQKQLMIHLNAKHLSNFCLTVAEKATSLCTRDFDSLGYMKDDSAEPVVYDGEDSRDGDSEIIASDSENGETECNGVNGDAVHDDDDDDVEMIS